VAVECEPGARSLIDALDRVLDKGVVIDAWVRLHSGGIDLTTGAYRCVAASVWTCVDHAQAAMPLLVPFEDPPDGGLPPAVPGALRPPVFIRTKARARSRR